MVASVGRINHAIAEQLAANPKPSRLPDDLLKELEVVISRTLGKNPKANRKSGVYLSKNLEAYFIIERIGGEPPIYGVGNFIYFKRNETHYSAKVRDIVDLGEAFIYHCNRPKSILRNEIPLNCVVTSKGGNR